METYVNGTSKYLVCGKATIKSSDIIKQYKND